MKHQTTCERLRCGSTATCKTDPRKLLTTSPWTTTARSSPSPFSAAYSASLSAESSSTAPPTSVATIARPPLGHSQAMPSISHHGQQNRCQPGLRPSPAFTRDFVTQVAAPSGLEDLDCARCAHPGREARRRLSRPLHRTAARPAALGRGRTRTVCQADLECRQARLPVPEGQSPRCRDSAWSARARVHKQGPVR